jgi:two-component system cell cycle sensor histidine kinase/response regulator CckA
VDRRTCGIQLSTKPQKVKSFQGNRRRTNVTDTAAVHGTILVVEDDDQVRRFITGLLEADGHTVLEARTGIEGAELAAIQPGRIDLLLTDMLLPGLSGYDLAARLRESSADLDILFITGYVEGEIVQRCISELNASFLDKPFQAATLRETVRGILTARRAAARSGA